ncbi:hypothetical protein [Pseudoalteromonas rubra]|uniref:hypothetical protein n=1 Tax=Pseudoalteromonas rubra TaxID=43658 RepID=UPI000F7A3D22|nr:hypothetical protein [Pseudoalteromonas rubra]
MKLILMSTILCFASCNLLAQSIYIDAVSNSLGNNSGTYKHVIVQRGLTYEIVLTENDAIFNTHDNAKMVNLGVMYVQPPRKMTIKTIEQGKKTYVETEGNLYFFFVDDARLNSGGATVDIKEVNQ